MVVFGLAWCEFGWSVTKFFDELGIPYRNVQIDRIEFQENDLGIQIRAGFEQMTGDEFDEMIDIFQDTLEDFDLDPEDISYLVKELRSRSHLIV